MGKIWEDDYSPVMERVLEPPIKFFLNQNELNSPLPSYSSRQEIEALSDTQICMVFHNFMVKVLHTQFDEFGNNSLTNKAKLFFEHSQEILREDFNLGVLHLNRAFLSLFIYDTFYAGYFKDINISSSKNGYLTIEEIVESFKTILLDYVSPPVHEYYALQSSDQQKFSLYSYLYHDDYTNILNCLPIEFFQTEQFAKAIFGYNGMIREDHLLKYFPTYLLKFLYCSGIDVRKLFSLNTEYLKKSNIEDIKDDINSWLYYTLPNKICYTIYSKIDVESSYSDFKEVFNYHSTLGLLHEYYYNFIYISSYNREVLHHLKEYMMTIPSIKHLLETIKSNLPESDKEKYKYFENVYHCGILSYFFSLYRDVIEAYKKEPNKPLSWLIEEVATDHKIVLNLNFYDPENIKETTKEWVDLLSERTGLTFEWNVCY